MKSPGKQNFPIKLAGTELKVQTFSTGECNSAFLLLWKRQAFPARKIERWEFINNDVFCGTS